MKNVSPFGPCRTTDFMTADWVSHAARDLRTAISRSIVTAGPRHHRCGRLRHLLKAYSTIEWSGVSNAQLYDSLSIARKAEFPYHVAPLPSFVWRAAFPACKLLIRVTRPTQNWSQRTPVPWLGGEINRSSPGHCPVRPYEVDVG